MPGPTFRFVHAADLHLDTPFKGIGQAAPEIAAALREASLDAFDNIVALALERQAAFVLIAGDIYDGAERGLRAQLRFRDGLERLSAAGIATFVVHGNHDPVETGWSAITSWPEKVTIFGTSEVTPVAVEKDGTVLATVQGLSYATSATTDNLALRFHRPEGPGVHIGLLHCNVEGAAAGYANYSPCTLDDLRRTGLDYLALGHIHQHTVLLDGTAKGEPWVVYPGNSQARSPRHSELQPKGAVVAEVVDGHVTSVEHVACDVVRFVEVTADISGLEDLAALERALQDGADAELEAAGGRAVVARAVVLGSGQLHAELLRAGVRDALIAALREERQGAAPFCWWNDLVDTTRPSLDRSAFRHRGDFLADLVALVDEIGGDPSVARRLLDDQGLPPRALLAGYESLVGDAEDVAAMLDEAADLALELLGAGGDGALDP